MLLIRTSFFFKEAVERKVRIEGGWVLGQERGQADGTVPQALARRVVEAGPFRDRDRRGGLARAGCLRFRCRIRREMNGPDCRLDCA